MKPQNSFNNTGCIKCKSYSCHFSAPTSSSIVPMLSRAIGSHSNFAIPDATVCFSPFPASVFVVVFFFFEELPLLGNNNEIV